MCSTAAEAWFLGGVSIRNMSSPGFGRLRWPSAQSRTSVSLRFANINREKGYSMLSPRKTNRTAMPLLDVLAGINCETGYGMLRPRKSNKTALPLLDVFATTCSPGECAAAGGGPADLPRRRFRVGPFWNALSMFSGGSEWPVEAVLDGPEVPSTARFRCEAAGDPSSRRL